MNTTIDYIDKLVQLSRLSLAGKPRDIQLFIKRLVQYLRKDAPDAADRLLQILQELPSPDTPLRSASISGMPVDRDSRLQLMRVENPVDITIDPIWPDTIYLALRQVVKEKDHKADLLKAGLSTTKSLLFTGEPGLGKTLAGRWLAQEMNLPLLILDLSAVMSSFLGRTGSNLRSVFDYAKGVPCVLFLDELDAIAKRRDDSTEIGELKRLVNVLLQEIDNWDDGGVLIAATNHATLLDPAIWRRFDLIVDFTFPGPEETLRAVELYLEENSNSSATKKEVIQVLATVLQGKSYSDIEREIKKIKRHAITSGMPIATVANEWVRNNVSHLRLQDKHKLALSLTRLGISQRDVHDLTGVSRDTIRKKMKSSQ